MNETTCNALSTLLFGGIALMFYLMGWLVGHAGQTPWGSRSSPKTYLCTSCGREHDRAAAVECILSSYGSISGRELRDLLRARGFRLSLPSFYQFMAGLEDKGLVRGEYRYETIDGTPVRQRWYRHVAAGATPGQ